MAVHTRLSKKDISDILSGYKVGGLLNFSGIQAGIENTNYKIKTTENNYILTVFEERVEKKNLPFFLDLMLLIFENQHQLLFYWLSAQFLFLQAYLANNF